MKPAMPMTLAEVRQMIVDTHNHVGTCFRARAVLIGATNTYVDMHREFKTTHDRLAEMMAGIRDTEYQLSLMAAAEQGATKR